MPRRYLQFLGLLALGAAACDSDDTPSNGNGVGATGGGGTHTGGGTAGGSGGQGAGGGAANCSFGIGGSIGSHLFSHSFPGEQHDSVIDIVLDGTDNSIVVGRFDENINLGGGLLSCEGQTDIFIGKFDPTGNHMWSHRYGSLDYQEPTAVTVDSAGNIVMVGTFHDSLNLGGSTLSSLLCTNIFVANHLESRRHG